MNRTSETQVGWGTSRLLPALLWLAGPSPAAVLPEGEGKPETVKLCGRCHSLDQSISLRQGRAAWEETMTKMVNLGAQGSDGELNKVLLYLVKFYGGADGSAPNAPMAPAITPLCFIITVPLTATETGCSFVCTNFFPLRSVM